MEAESPILSLKGVRKAYGQNVVLDNLDLEIHPGRFYALLGRNGTGKSTLMRLLMRHEAWDKGSGQAFGVDMALDRATFNENTGFVSENVFFHFLKMNVKDILDYQKTLRPRWDDAYVAEALRLLKIPAEASYGALSRGQKMQVAFLTATAFSPRLLLLDEITSVLDLVARDYFLSRLDRFVDEGGTVVVATNIISEVQHYLDQVILLQEKKVKFNAGLQDLRSQFVRAVKRKGNHHGVFSSPDCVELGMDPEGTLHLLLPKELAAGLPPGLLSPEAPSVSDIFLFMSKARE